MKIRTADLERLLFEQKGRCFYCSTPLSAERHLEHKVPLARGGAHALENVCWSCPPCNLRKSTKTAQEFLGQEKCA